MQHVQELPAEPFPIRLIAELAGDGGTTMAAALVLDTGAERTVLSGALAETLSIPLDQSSQQLTTGLGHPHEAHLGWVTVRVGPITRRLQAWFVKGMEEGLLGGDFLRTVRLTVDPAARRLVLDAAEPDPH